MVKQRVSQNFTYAQGSHVQVRGALGGAGVAGCGRGAGWGVQPCLHAPCCELVHPPALAHMFKLLGSQRFGTMNISEEPAADFEGPDNTGARGGGAPGGVQGSPGGAVE